MALIYQGTKISPGLGMGQARVVEKLRLEPPAERPREPEQELLRFRRCYDAAEEDLRKILTEPRQALIRQYTALLETEGVTVTFTEDSVSEIAEIASVVNSETEDIGARRLYTILERVLEELSFEASELENKEVTIDGAYVRQKLGEITKDMDTSNYIL